MHRLAIATTLLLSSGLSLACQAQVAPQKIAADLAGTPAGTVMTDEYVRTIGRMAYIWGWPLAKNLTPSLGIKDLPELGRIAGVIPASPSMLTDYINAAENFVTCPNQDTVYGAGVMCLDISPEVIQVSDFSTRFFTYQITDTRTDTIGRIGAQYDRKPGFYLLVGPGWKGKVPAGFAKVIRSSTNLAAIFPRAFQDDTAEEKTAIQPLLS